MAYINLYIFPSKTDVPVNHTNKDEDLQAISNDSSHYGFREEGINTGNSCGCVLISHKLKRHSHLYWDLALSSTNSSLQFVHTTQIIYGLISF